MRASTLLKQRLGQPGIIVAPGCYDGLSVRLVQEAGFDTAYASGGAIAPVAHIATVNAARLRAGIARGGAFAGSRVAHTTAVTSAKRTMMTRRQVNGAVQCGGGDAERAGASALTPRSAIRPSRIG